MTTKHVKVNKLPSRHYLRYLRLCYVLDIDMPDEPELNYSRNMAPNMIEPTKYENWLYWSGRCTKNEDQKNP